MPFELKSTTGNSISTVRDFGPDHVRKWEGMHWIFGFYDAHENLKYCRYASPQQMRGWIEGRWNYVKPDWNLADVLPGRVAPEDLPLVLDGPAPYSINDAKAIQKKQYSAAKYRALSGENDEVEQDVMTSVLSDRVRYLMERGATLNNPKIAESYLQDLVEIRDNHAATLRLYVERELKKPPLEPLVSLHYGVLGRSAPVGQA